MRLVLRISLFFLSGVLMAGSCRAPIQKISGGGKGGTCVIAVSGEHHGSLLDTCKVYIKYNAVDAPANGIYDDSAASVLIDTIPTAIFSGLTTGNYYLYAVGYHGGFSPPNVKGGKSSSIYSGGDTLKVILPTYQYNP